MNLSKGKLLLSTSSTSALDVLVSYCNRGKGDESSMPDNKATAFSAISTKTEILGRPAATAYGRVIDEISIRNKGAASNTVTLWFRDESSGSVVDYELYEVAIGADQELVYNGDTGVYTLNTHSTIGLWSTYTAPADLLNTANDVLADVTGLTAPVLSGYVYEFEAVIAYSADATTTGSRWTVNGPAATWLAYTSKVGLTASSDTITNATAYQLPAAAGATSPTTTGNIAVIRGFVKPSADGTLAIQNAAENTGGANDITALAGSQFRVRRVL